MLIHDDIFSWEGFGGQLRLGSGKCRLRVFDLRKGKGKGLDYLRPIIVIVSDIPESKMSVRSCAGHIATCITSQFSIDPSRMLYIEHYPEVIYGEKKKNLIPERYDAIEFTWHEEKALKLKWRTLKSPLRDLINNLMEDLSR